jgi:hypothetical protein
MRRLFSRPSEFLGELRRANVNQRRATVRAAQWMLTALQLAQYVVHLSVAENLTCLHSRCFAYAQDQLRFKG